VLRARLRTAHGRAERSGRTVPRRQNPRRADPASGDQPHRARHHLLRDLLAAAPTGRGSRAAHGRSRPHRLTAMGGLARAGPARVDRSYAAAMTPPPSVPRTVRVALGWAALERQRGRRAAAVAARHEERATAGPEVMREFHERLAPTHRRAEQRHYTAARMHESFAARLRAREPEVAQLLRVFMAAVAETADVAGAAVTLFGPESVETLAAASDERAKAVQDIEFALGEGPAHSSVELHSAVRARGAALLERWPVFGPA